MVGLTGRKLLGGLVLAILAGLHAELSRAAGPRPVAVKTDDPDKAKSTADPKLSFPALAPVPASEPSADPKRLRTDIEGMRREREDAARAARDDSDSLAVERAKLRAELLSLIKRLSERAATSVPPPSPRPKEVSPPKFDLGGDNPHPLDAVRMAQNLFKAGDFDAALRAFRLIDITTLGREDRAFVQYMTACCLRKTGKVPEATVLYREIAEAKEDDFITECAVWQLGNIRTAQELEAQLEDLRARRKGR